MNQEKNKKGSPIADEKHSKLILKKKQYEAPILILDFIDLEFDIAVTSNADIIIEEENQNLFMEDWTEQRKSTYDLW